MEDGERKRDTSARSLSIREYFARDIRTRIIPRRRGRYPMMSEFLAREREREREAMTDIYARREKERTGGDITNNLLS